MEQLTVFIKGEKALYQRLKKCKGKPPMTEPIIVEIRGPIMHGDLISVKMSNNVRLTVGIKSLWKIETQTGVKDE